MENILNAIFSQLGDDSLQAISKQANVSPTQAKSALASAMPILMSALAKNSSTKEGASALQNALKKDHDGSLLDNLGGFLNNPAVANGAGILKHALGSKRQNVEQYISKDSGLSGASASKILEIAAPLVMSYLGKRTVTGGGNAVGNLLNTYLKTEKKQAPKAQSVISQLLDRNNDGNVADDIAELGKSFLGRMMKKR